MSEHQVILEETFMVTIENKRAKKDWPKVKTNPLVQPFTRWLLDNEIYAIRGTSSSGPHFFTAVFPISRKPEIEAYFDAL